MAIKLIRTTTIDHACALVQRDADGKELPFKMRVRFNVIPRDKFADMLADPDAHDGVFFDSLVNRILDEVEDDSGNPLEADAAKAILANDLSLSSQIVRQGIELQTAGAAKNVSRSRGR